MTEMTREELGQVLRVVAAATRRTFGEADIAIWHPIIKDVPVEWAKQAVVAHFRDYPGVWLEPGHIYQRWRTFRLDQVARESREEREARQAALDAAKVDPDILALARAKAIPEEEPKFKRGGMNGPKSVKCPWCKARVAQPCVERHSQQPLTKTAFHPGRVEAWEATQ